MRVNVFRLPRSLGPARFLFFEFSLNSLAFADWRKGSLLLIAREALIRYAGISGFAGAWSAV